ncbi:hypothetical protein [Halovivax gelatinilyticus]|uniref:hypothetical protein n=1 Tax=Halovivax gelatinilyticus TaxID=2961597 RepID=UPI0020CA2A70|nr:hypothetical protein [Halovivax gelatinilyticus]
MSGGPDGGEAGDAVASANQSADRTRRRCSRRTVLLAAGGTAAFATPVFGSARSSGESATAHVVVHPGPTPLYARLVDGPVGLASPWTTVHAAAAAAVEDALEQVAEHAERTGRDRFTVAVERGDPVGAPLSVFSPLDALVPADRIYERFREVVESGRDAADARCHLLLWWSPLDVDLGYGRTVPGNGRVGPDGDTGGLTVANIGATELWDGRAVTRNMAIHEVLHTYLESGIVASITGSGCDHSLGRVVETAAGVREVTPMATAYAGGSAPFGSNGDVEDWSGATAGISAGLVDSGDGDTRFQGRGCGDHDSFVRHDGTDGVSTWTHTTALSEETKEAVCRYAERSLR